VTSYFKTATNDPDDRVLDVTRVTSTDVIAKDLKVFLAESFPNMNILPDADVGDGGEVPEGCVTIGEVRDAVDGRMDVWFRRGVAQRSRWEAAKAAGEFICRQNPSDGSQVDLVVPNKIVPHLAKFSLVVQSRA
jgi:phage tail sheath gpL-like